MILIMPLLIFITHYYLSMIQFIVISRPLKICLFAGIH